VRVLRLESSRAARRRRATSSALQSTPLATSSGSWRWRSTYAEPARGPRARPRRFIATASHELRTPIFSLGGFLELIQDEALDEETRRQFVGQVREQVERLGKLATQLLDLSRLEAGSSSCALTTTDLGVLTRAVSAEFVPALAQHDSRLELRLPGEPDCDPCVCDPSASRSCCGS
jgi:signal transduction histidine kinase